MSAPSRKQVERLRDEIYESCGPAPGSPFIASLAEDWLRLDALVAQQYQSGEAEMGVALWEWRAGVGDEKETNQ